MDSDPTASLTLLSEFSEREPLGLEIVITEGYRN